MGIRLYNTLTRKKEDFETIEPGNVRMYVCGPTVYNQAHVGHAMSAMVFDIIRRYLEFRGYQVNHAMNFTDVDDKIINRANQQGVDPFELAEKYIQEYVHQLDALNIKKATVNPRATREMPQIIAMIEGLIEKGFAYPANGDVYFRVDRKVDYGKLSGRKLEEMHAGARIGIGEMKEHPMDFALWKAAKPGEPSWTSPWGEGRPGWHIECSAMNLTHFGPQIDIHGGGNDLIFPHHENEIAQSEGYSGERFSRYWVHNGMLQLSGEKMSKSLGNLVTIDEFLQEHSGDVLRMMVLNSGYRNPLTFSDEVLDQTEKGLERLKSALKPALPGAKGVAEEAVTALEAASQSAEKGFIASMDDDFNSAGALGSLFDLVRVVNQTRANGATDEQLHPAQEKLSQLSGVFGLTLENDQAQAQEAAPFIELLIEIRRELRAQKLWALSDQVRNQLLALGVVLEDSKEGTSWHFQP